MEKKKIIIHTHTKYIPKKKKIWGVEGRVNVDDKNFKSLEFLGLD